MKKTRSVLIALLLVLSATASGADVRYDFESINIDSGPDTFQLFEHGDVNVSINSYYAYRGNRSLHLQDKSNSKSFPEFQGYFPNQTQGKLQLSFALMTPDLNEKFNIALAGQGHFYMVENGLGFWLFNDNGVLRHMSDGIAKKVVKLVAYQWYWFDIELDLDRGEYQLFVADEFGETLVSLSNQVHPTSRANSGLNKYSFIGDLEDTGNANFFIDEFSLRTSQTTADRGFVAPGRRSLFIDQWHELNKKSAQIDYCLPATIPYDFIQLQDQASLDILKANTDLLKALISNPKETDYNAARQAGDVFSGMADWAQGCQMLKQKNYSAAVITLEKAQAALGDVPAVQLALAMAYARAGDVYNAQSVLRYGQSVWPNDTRWTVAAAAVGFISDDVALVNNALATVVNNLTYSKSDTLALMENIGWVFAPAARVLSRQQVWDERTKIFILLEQHYFALLWQQQYVQALGYANQLIEQLAKYDINSPLWLERAADAAFLQGDLSSAETAYLNILKTDENKISALQKLADVYFLQGNAQQERVLRESLFGVLDYD